MNRIPAKQGGTGGKSMPNGHATHSGSRPKGGKTGTPSSAPPAAQRIRG
jgi:hypothetical protein